MSHVKVLQLTSSPAGMGGVERLLMDAAPMFDAAGFDVRFANLFGSEAHLSPYVAGIRYQGIPCTLIAGSSVSDVPRMLGQLYSLVRREEFDIIHSHMLHASIIGATIARVGGVGTLVSTRHYTQEGYENHGSVLRMVDNAAVRYARHVIAVSGSVKRDLVDRVGVIESRIRVVHNGIDVRRFRNPSSGPWEWVRRWPDGWFIGMIGSLVPRKGQADLLEAVALLKDTVPTLRVVLVGEGPRRGALEAIAARLSIADRVHFAGFQDDIPGVLASWQGYVHTAHEEPFGIAVLEAMAAGVPVVTTSAGGIPEIISSSEIAIMTAVGDVTAIADGIRTLFQNPGLARVYARAGRKEVTNRFSVESTVRGYEAVYVEAMKARVGRE